LICPAKRLKRKKLPRRRKPLPEGSSFVPRFKKALYPGFDILVILPPANFHLRGEVFSWEGVFSFSSIHSGIEEFQVDAGCGADLVQGCYSLFLLFP
jgi:hypothetical protein